MAGLAEIAGRPGHSGALQIGGNQRLGAGSKLAIDGRLGPSGREALELVGAYAGILAAGTAAAAREQQEWNGDDAHQ